MKIIKSRRKSIAVEITEEAEVLVRAPLWMRDDEIARFIDKKRSWIDSHLEKMKKKRAKKPPLTREYIDRLADEALLYIPKRVEYFSHILGVTYGNITIRNQKTRWGSCSSKGNLNFNCMLMLKDKDVIDYVVVHELCHRKEMNHSEKFWAEVEKVLPDYKERRKRLKEDGRA